MCWSGDGLISPELLPEERGTLIAQAAKDSYGPIRRIGFEALAAEQGPPIRAFTPFLRDRSARDSRGLPDAAAPPVWSCAGGTLPFGVTGAGGSGRRYLLGWAPSADLLIDALAADALPVAREAVVTLIAGRIVSAETIWRTAARNRKISLRWCCGQEKRQARLKVIGSPPAAVSIRREIAI